MYNNRSDGVQCNQFGAKGSLFYTTIGCVLSLSGVMQTPCHSGYCKISLRGKKHLIIIIVILATISNGALRLPHSVHPPKCYYKKKGQLVYTLYIKFKLRSHYPLYCLLAAVKKGNGAYILYIIYRMIVISLEIYHQLIFAYNWIILKLSSRSKINNQTFYLFFRF